jgi:hypothetical protein
MKRLTLTGILLLTLPLLAQTPPRKLWGELEENRSRFPSVHQEFEVAVTYKARGGIQASKRTVIVDMSQGQWREASMSGAGDRVHIFDGENTFQLEEGGDEFVRVKRGSKDALPTPSPYSFGEIDWKRAKEISSQPCGFLENDHTCVILELPRNAMGCVPNQIATRRQTCTAVSSRRH